VFHHGEHGGTRRRPGGPAGSDPSPPPFSVSLRVLRGDTPGATPPVRSAMPHAEDFIDHFVAVVLTHMDREYPNKPDHVMNDETDIRSPRALHPIFYGSFDWHSSVHGHWLLIRALKNYP